VYKRPNSPHLFAASVWRYDLPAVSYRNASGRQYFIGTFQSQREAAVAVDLATLLTRGAPVNEKTAKYAKALKGHFAHVAELKDTIYGASTRALISDLAQQFFKPDSEVLAAVPACWNVIHKKRTPRCHRVGRAIKPASLAWLEFVIDWDCI
jgi:hypothetical protein